jgi:hypothetical protein
MIRKRLFLSVGGLRSVFDGVEDYDLWLRLAEANEIANLPEVVAYYRVHASGASRARAQQLIIATVGAQLSARARSARLSDPYADISCINYTTLVQTATSTNEVNTLLMDAAAGEATFLGMIGRVNEALALLQWADGVTRGGQTARRAQARAHLARGVLSWRSNRTGAALISMLHAVLLDPRRTASRFANGARAEAISVSARLIRRQ